MRIGLTACQRRDFEPVFEKETSAKEERTSLCLLLNFSFDKAAQVMSSVYTGCVKALKTAYFWVDQSQMKGQ